MTRGRAFLSVASRSHHPRMTVFFHRTTIMARASPVLAFLLAAAIASADGLRDERTWTGKNGKTLRGTYHRLRPDGKQVEILTGNGTLLAIALENLCDDDQAFIRGGGVPVAPDTPVAPQGETVDFRPCAFPERSSFTWVPTEDAGGKFPKDWQKALWTSCLWWDASGVLDLPVADSSRKHQRFFKDLLKRELRSADDAVAALESIYRGSAAFRTFSEPKDFRAERLASFATGPNLVFLYLSPKGAIRSRLAMLESITPDGNFVLHMGERRLVGKVRSGGPDHPRIPHGESVFHVSNTQDLPPDLVGKTEELETSGTYTRCVVVKPYVYAKPGTASPPPPDADFPVCVPPAAKPAAPVVE